MMKDLSFRRKFFLLLAVFVCFWMVAYQFPIRKAMVLYRECNKLRAQLSQVHNADERMNELQFKIDRMEEQYSLGSDSNRTKHEFIFSELMNLCDNHKIALTNYPEMVRQVQSNFSIETNRFELTGSFAAILEGIYKLEKLGVGRISSVSFETKKDMRAKREYLLATLYLQNIKRSNEGD